MNHEDDPPIAIPEWVVTFGDMMSLLLTFFIMLVSLSEMKSEEKYQAIVESMQHEFGYDRPRKPIASADSSSESVTLPMLPAAGDVPSNKSIDSDPQIRIIRDGKRTAIGAAVLFDPGASELTEAGRNTLDQLVPQFAGKGEKIEVRGHSDAEAARRAVNLNDNVDLGYARAKIILEYLVNHHQFSRDRFRLASAGEHEPMHVGIEDSRLRMNARAEVFLLDETVGELQGTQEERKQMLLKNSKAKGKDGEK